MADQRHRLGFVHLHSRRDGQGSWQVLGDVGHKEETCQKECTSARGTCTPDEEGQEGEGEEGAEAEDLYSPSEAGTCAARSTRDDRSCSLVAAGVAHCAEELQQEGRGHQDSRVGGAAGRLGGQERGGRDGGVQLGPDATGVGASRCSSFHSDTKSLQLHHAPSLFLHPSRRVRVLTAALHLSLVQIAAVKEQLLFFLRETASTAQVESLLGSWCVAAHDVDKAVASSAMKSWKDPELRPDGAALFEFVQRTALDPAGTYAYLNPMQPSVAPPSHPGSKKRGPPPPSRAVPEPRSKAEEENEENEQDRKARLRFGALGALRWMLESLDPLPEGLLPLFGNPALLTAVQSNLRTPGVDIEAFGYGQPSARRNMWALLQILLSARKGQLQDVASELARAVLRSAFVEADSNVQSAMWYPLLLFLKGAYVMCNVIVLLTVL